MPKTQLFTIELDEFQKIDSGAKNFIVQRMLTPLEPGQRIIIQSLGTDAEIEATLIDVHAEPGMHKGWYILAFPFKKGKLVDVEVGKYTATQNSSAAVVDFSPMLEVGTEEMNDTALAPGDKS